MKRYTGQQALYEAISRSRAKAKQGSILDKLLPDASKTETPAAGQTPPGEPQQVQSVPAIEPLPQTPAVPSAVETPPQPVIEQTPQVEPRVEVPAEPMAELASPPLETAEPIVKSRPIERVSHPAPPSPVQTWLKPRPVQLNEGRIEISVPYYVGVIAGLVVLVIVLVSYRLGQGGSGGQANDAAPKVQSVSDRSTNPPSGSMPQGATAANTSQPLSSPVTPGAAGQDVTAAVAQGDHMLILARSRRQEDFEPVVRYFHENGIEVTSASLDALRRTFAEYKLDVSRLPSGDGFLLVTANFYGNPKVAGTDGFKIKQRITEVGATYKGKAPSGYESFAPNYFSDTYGMKVR
jgi:hypothetical protein